MEEMQFDQDALAALEDKTKPFLFLTGEAGCGKTTLVNRWKDTTKLKVATIAPTGCAAILSGGVTIHRFFRMQVREWQEPDAFSGGFKLLDEKKKPRFDVLLIDEISMVRADVMQFIYNTLTFADVNMTDWGGILVRVVGDLSQIPPIVDDRKVKTSAFIKANFSGRYFFNAPCLAKGFHAYMMQSNFRQAGDERFKKMLNIIRKPDSWGKHRNYVISEINKLNKQPSPQSVFLCSKNSDADLINATRLSRIEEALVTNKGILENMDNKDLPAPENLELKAGCRVLMLANTDDFANGHTGTYLGSGYDSEGDPYCSVMLDAIDSVGMEERCVWVYPYTWEITEWAEDENGKLYSKKEKRYTQYPMKVGYAMSIHKSQGMSIPKVHVNLGSCGAFDHGMLYVAFSRCMSESGLTIQYPLKEKDFIYDPASNHEPFVI